MTDHGKRRKTLIADDMLRQYAAGRREFHGVNLDGAQLGSVDLSAASFYYGSLRETKLVGANLTYVQFKGADLTGANLSGARVNAADLIAANFRGAKLRGADLTGTSLNGADCTGCDMRGAYLNRTRLGDVILTSAKLEGVQLSGADLCDLDVGPLCDAKRVRHHSPSNIDSRTVMRTYRHPGLKAFMLDCGVPGIFAEYMIDCARSLGEPLMRSLMQSTFISYGGPDEAFARQLYDALKAHNVIVFFFPESATVGERIDNEVFRRIQQNDRVILVCSRSSLDRTGVLNEIQEAFDREARDGGATYLLPIMLDDYVLTAWRTRQPELAERVRRRIVGDFRGAARSRKTFEKSLTRLLDALKTKRPSVPLSSAADDSRVD